MTTSSLRDRREEFKAGAARYGDQRRTEFLEQALSDKRSKIEEMRMLAFSNDRTSSKIVPATQHYADISDDDDPDLYDEDEFSASCAPGSCAGHDDEASLADADGEASIADEHDEDHSHHPNHQPQTRRKKHQHLSAASVARKDKAKVKFRQFAGMFLQPDWLLPTKDCIPGDLLARKWFACVRPEGDRVLVFSDSGHTQIRRRNGTVLQNWFRDHRFPKGQTVLDGILCSTNSAIVYVMDVLVWADVALHESEFDFRYFWLQSRLTEENWEEEKKIVMSATHFDGGVNYPGNGGGARGGWKNSRRNARRSNRGKKGTNTIGIGNAPTAAASEMEIDNEAPAAPAGGSAANDAGEQNEAQTQPQQQPRKKTLRLGPAVPAISADMDMTGAAGSVSAAATTTAKKSQLSEVDKVKQTDDTLEFFSLQLVPQTEIGSVDELKQLYRSAPDYVPDGIQFTHVEARYTPGLTPCVLTWKDLHCSRYAIDNFGVGAIASSGVVVATTNPDDVEEASILQLTASGGLLTSDGLEIAKVEVREVAVEPDLPVVHEDDEGMMAEHEPAASLPPAPLVKIANLRPTFPTRNSYVRVVLKSVNREEQRVEIDIRKLRKARIRTYADSWARIQFQHMLRRRTKEDLFELLLREVATHSE